jgi:hypothetical protein
VTPDFASLHPGYNAVMKRLLLAVVLAILATAAHAQQPFATVTPGNEAWWLRTSFNPMHTDVRGIPVGKIRRTWCKATEFTRDLMPKQEMEQEKSGQVMDEVGLAFSFTGNFDRSKTKQVALVGVYQECAGKKGSFLLIIDESTQKVRFLDTTPSETQFAILSVHKNDIVLAGCMECDAGGVLRWNAKRQAFRWVPQRGHD